MTVSAATLAGPSSGRVEHDLRRVGDVGHADRARPPAVDLQRLAGGREPAELVHHGLRLGAGVLDGLGP